MNTTDVTIVRLGTEDRATLIQAIRLFREEDLSAARARLLLSDPTQNYLVARDTASGDLIGWCNAVAIQRPRQNELFLFEMDVTPAWRNQGVGRRLISGFFDLAKILGCREAFVFTHQSNSAAMALYQSTGARQMQNDDVLLVWDLNSPVDTSLDLIQAGLRSAPETQGSTLETLNLERWPSPSANAVESVARSSSRQGREET
ncbi:MAG: GNAT family N-acetyltransferase [Bdellovibrionota bacterium]